MRYTLTRGNGEEFSKKFFHAWTPIVTDQYRHWH
jgi:hypothetical protein